ncbi:MAG: hypothetical protein WCS17_08405 [Prevotella sp.]
MIYSPHILQLKSSTSGKDERGKPIKSTDQWTDVCTCRCDDNTTKEFKTEDGKVYVPSFHIVCSKQVSVKVGDQIQCIDASGNVRGNGKIFNVKNLNYLNYSELWV